MIAAANPPAPIDPPILSMSRRVMIVITTSCNPSLVTLAVRDGIGTVAVKTHFRHADMPATNCDIDG
jgi:hypothetical protein